MTILLTNDDGFGSKGILTLQKVLKKHGRVIVMAPRGKMSAKSCAITCHFPIPCEKVSEDEYILDGTPADCVSTAIGELGIDFDLVISGCNHGLNMSYDVIYSGTVACSVQALTFKIPAIAVSCEDNFDLVEKHFDEVFSFITKNNLLSLEYLLNVNFPIGNTVKKIEIGSLYYKENMTYKQRFKDNYCCLDYLENEINMPKNCDCYQVTHGIVSIVPLGKTPFHESYLKELQEKIK